MSDLFKRKNSLKDNSINLNEKLNEVDKEKESTNNEPASNLPKHHFVVRSNSDEKKNQATVGVAAGGAAALGGGAAINYATIPTGLSDDEIERFLPDEDTPLNDANFICSHNAFTEYDPLGNQYHDTTWLLNNTPTRAFQLDIKQDSDGNFYIQHDLHGGGTPPSLDDALKELNDWLEKNPDQVIMIDIDSESSIQRCPDLAKAFKDAFEDKINSVGHNPTIGEMTEQGNQVVFRFSGFNPTPEWSDFHFVQPNNVFAHNDSVPYFFGHGFPYFDEEAFRWSDNNNHFITSEQLKEYYDNNDGALFMLDDINRYTFKNPEGLESDPTIGPFRESSPAANTFMVGSGVAKMSFGIIGPAALTFFQYNNICKKVNELAKNPSKLDDATHKQLLIQTARLGASVTSAGTNSLLTAGIIYPGLLDPFGIAAVATAGAGVLGTLGAVGHTHSKLKDIANKDGIYKFWPDQNASLDESLRTTQNAKPNKEEDSVSIDRTSNNEKLQNLMNIVSSLSVLMRFTSTTKYLLPAVAPAAAGLGLGLATTLSSIDAISHNKLTSDFVKNPEKAIDYYRNKNIQSKKYIFAGDSKVTKFLDIELKNSKKAQKKLEDITDSSNCLNNGHDVLNVLTSTKEEFLHSELKCFLEMLKTNELKDLDKILSSVSSKSNNLFSSFISCFKPNQKEYSAENIILQLAKTTDKWNLFTGMKQKNTLKGTDNWKLKKLDKSMKTFWEQINKLYKDKLNSKETFQESFMKKLVNRQEYLLYSLKACAKDFEKDTISEFSKKSGKVPKWLDVIIQSYLKQPESFKEKNSLIHFIDLKIKNHYFDKAKKYPEQKKHYQDKAKKRTHEFNSIVEQAFGWKIKNIMRNDIRKHGLLDTAQIAISTGALGLVFPHLSGCTFAAATGAMAVGTATTEVVARKRTNNWEKNYRAKFIDSETNTTNNNFYNTKDVKKASDSPGKIELNINGRGPILFQLKDGELFRCRKDNQESQSRFPLVIKNENSTQTLKFEAFRKVHDKLQLLSKNGKEISFYELSWDKNGNKHLDKIQLENKKVPVELAKLEPCSKTKLQSPALQFS